MRTLDAGESQEMNGVFFSNYNRPHAQTWDWNEHILKNVADF